MATLTIVLFSAAITVVFTQGGIFKPLREHGPKFWRDLSSCALCSGVWIGAAIYCLFSGFPHVGDDLWVLARAATTVVGVGAASGCVALLFVAVWEKLDARPAAVSIETAKMYVYDPQVNAQRVKFMAPQPFVPEEAPTDPSTGPGTSEKLTQRIPIDQLQAARKESRRSKP